MYMYNVAAVASWCVCLCLISAKPVGNLTLCVFQRYYAELCSALSAEPHQMAREMYSKELISEEMMRRVVKMRDPFLDKADVLVQMIQNRIAAENSSKTLMSFCQLLKRRPVLGSIAVRMKARLGEEVSRFVFCVALHKSNKVGFL